MATSLCLSSSSSPHHLSLFNSNLRPCNSSKPFAALTSSAAFSCRRPPLLLRSHETPKKIRRGCRASAAAEDVLPSAAEAQEIVSGGGGDGVSTVISALLLVAFIGLSILTVGVIYIAVTDYLQKREGEKFEKEEAAKRKSGKKGKVRARSRAGPKGFGQKINDEDEFDD